MPFMGEYVCVERTPAKYPAAKGIKDLVDWDPMSCIANTYVNAFSDKSSPRIEINFGCSLGVYLVYNCSSAPMMGYIPVAKYSLVRKKHCTKVAKVVLLIRYDIYSCEPNSLSNRLDRGKNTATPMTISPNEENVSM
jgi:hypothetical protein